MGIRRTACAGVYDEESRTMRCWRTTRSNSTAVSSRIQSHLVLLVLAAVVCLTAVPANGAEQAEIRQSVARASGFLRGGLGKVQGGYRSLLSYALLKAGQPTDSPE